MKIFVKEEVFADLLQIVKWYQERSTDAALAFLNEWELSLSFISENPYTFQIKFN